MDNQRNEKIKLGIGMDQKNKNFEQLIRDAFSQHRITPSQQLWTKIRRKLDVADFFSPNMRKLNIYYASTIIVGAVLLAHWMDDTKDGASEINRKHTIVETQENIGNSNKTDHDAEKVGSGQDSSTEGDVEKQDIFSMHPSSGCTPLKVRFEGINKNIVSYNWDFGNGKVSSAQNPIINYQKPGVYNIKLIAKYDNGKEERLTKELKVYQKPTADFKIDKEASDKDQKIVALENKSSNAKAFIWNFGDNKKKETNIDKIFHPYKENKSYKISLVAKSVHGCKDTAYLTNNFLVNKYSISFPNQFVTNTISKPSNSSVNIAENSGRLFFPNHNGIKEYELKVYAPNGIVIFYTTDINKGWNGYVKNRAVPSGIYHYEASGTFPNNEDFTVKGKVKVITNDYFNDYN